MNQKLLKLICILLFLTQFGAYGTNFYISNTGNDANSGLTPASAWKTIQKLNASWAVINAGDNIYFERGGTFFGSIIVGKSGTTLSKITIGAYGTGEKPIITLVSTLSGWQNVGTNLWEAPVTTQKTNLNLVTINGTLQRMGRYPNFDAPQDGWLPYNGTIDATQFSPFSVPTPFTQNWVGGIVVARKSNYVYDLCRVISQPTSTTMTIENPPSFYGGYVGTDYAGYGYFIENHPLTLDQQDEWYYNGSTKKLRMYSTTDPSLRDIKMPIWDTLVNLGAQQNIVLDNLNLQYSNNFGVYSDAPNNTIQNSIMRYINAYIVDFEKDNSNFYNNLVRDCQGRGVYLWGGGDVLDNTIQNVGVLEGMGQSSYDAQQAIAVKSENGSNNVLRNTIDSIGFNGIRFEGSNKLIQNNYIQRCCLAQNDGGGIYSYATGLNSFQFLRKNQIVRKNIVVNLGKCLWGVPTTQRCISHPLYMDGQVNNVLIDSNFAGLSLGGQNANSDNNNVSVLQGINNTFLTIRANVFFGFPNALGFYDFGGNLVTYSNNRIVSNCFYVNKTAANLPNNQQNNSFQYITLRAGGNTTFQSALTNIGYMDSNYISNYTPAPFDWYSTNPFSDPPAMKLDPLLPNYPSPQWRLYTGHDLVSQEIPDGGNSDYQWNPTFSNTIYKFAGLSKKDFRGVVYNDQAIIPAFSGNIFIPNGTSTQLYAQATATPILCNGGNSTVTVSATGGNPPYTGTGTFTRAAGTWTFTVTDASLNTFPVTITISQPTAITAGVPQAVAASGGATVTQPLPTGGTPPYTYQLDANSFQSSNVFFNVSAGAHTITIKDANNCTLSQPVQVVTNVPPYKYQIIAVNYGSNTWNNGTQRNVTVTIQNVGSYTWVDGTCTTTDINIGIQFAQWRQYYVRVNAGNLQPNETRTYTIPVTARYAKSKITPRYCGGTVTYSDLLPLSQTFLKIDVVNEQVCWLGDNGGICNGGNRPYVSPFITIVP